MPGSATIEVALATYNSEPFLAELLDSLFGQSVQHFSILVSDDGSTDATLAIVRSYQLRFPGRIRLIGSAERPGGPSANFSRLMEALSADYAMLCDHDDVWLPDKIALSLSHMRGLETRHGPSTPVLVHTDLAVVGPGLEILSPSFFAYQRLDPTWNGLRALLLANTVTGCTAMANRPLYERARPIPADAAMHDHWLALVAAATGRIGCLRESTILYRQHGGNAIGAVAWNPASFRDRVRAAFTGDGKKRMLELFSRQAGALLDRCGSEMSPERKRAAAALAGLWSLSPWRRFLFLWRNGFVVNGFLRNAALFVTVTRPSGPARRFQQSNA